MLIVLLLPYMAAQLLLPSRVRLLGSQVGKNEGEDVVVPVHRLALDAVFDILSQASVSAGPGRNMPLWSLRLERKSLVENT